jgi:hypothetical protein
MAVPNQMRVERDPLPFFSAPLTSDLTASLTCEAQLGFTGTSRLILLCRLNSAGILCFSAQVTPAFRATPLLALPKAQEGLRLRLMRSSGRQLRYRRSPQASIGRESYWFGEKH